MKALLIAAALAAAADPAVPPLNEAKHAIEAGRLDQARIMIANAVKAGADGPTVDRLLAELAFVSGEFELALTRYEALLATDEANALYGERAGISALQTGDLHRAREFLDKATAGAGASWEAWNARGVVADQMRDWERADAAYDSAAALAPDRPEILNNMGWSLLLRGEWAMAVDLFERAAALDPKSTRIADNLELARAAVSGELPGRKPGESDEDWSARLNDVGVLAVAGGNYQRAVAAFSRAIRARSEWFERASNNLALAEARR